MDSNFGNRSTFSFGRLLLNFLTTLIILATVTSIAVFAVVFVNPQIFINPFPPAPRPTDAPLPVTPTADLPAEATAIVPSPTSSPLPATETASPTATLTSTPSATPSPTPTLTPNPSASPTATPSATATPLPPEYTLQAGSPAAQQRWWPPYDQLCSWMGVGGHVFDAGGRPIVGLAVHLGGTLNGSPVDLDAFSGSASEILGGSGYLFSLGNRPIASENTLWLQLKNADTGLALSDRVFITTYSTCESNLILVNWRKVK